MSCPVLCPRRGASWLLACVLGFGAGDLHAATMTFAPTADARVEEHSTNANFATAELGSDAGSGARVRTYLRFAVSGSGGAVTSAKLRLYATGSTVDGPSVAPAGSAWTEPAVTWANQPGAVGAAVANVGAITSASWVEWDVSSLVHGDGNVEFVLEQPSTDGADFSAREGAHPGELVIEQGADAIVHSFVARADARVDEALPGSQFGASFLRCDGGSSKSVQTFLEFEVKGLTGPVLGAEVRLRATSSTTGGPSLYRTASGWAEADLTWTGRPLPTGSALASKKAIAGGSLVALNVKAAVTGNGVYAFVLLPGSSDGVEFTSREQTDPPMLVVTCGAPTGCLTVDCDDANVCTADACDAQTGCQHGNLDGPCDADASACTADACAGAVCLAGAATTCDDADPCTADSCESATGSCLFSVISPCIVPPAPEPPPACPAACQAWSAPTDAGQMADSGVNELSGLAASRLHPGVLYGHNDTGDGPRIFAATTSGKALGRIAVTGAVAVDWEDMALGPCPTGDCLYVGDIGDNSLVRKTYVIYRVPEPAIAVDAPIGTVDAPAEAFAFTYPGGVRNNAETLLVHPQTGAVYVITKRSPGKPSSVFRLPQPLQASEVAQLVLVAELPIATADSALTGGDIHPCGDRLLLRNYNSLYLLQAAAGAPFDSAFTAAVTKVPVASEVQGEAVTWRTDGLGWFTASEGSKPWLHRTLCVP